MAGNSTSSMGHSAMQYGVHRYEKQAHDFYVEPRWTVEMLLEAESFFGTVWDPAAGSGNIPETCKAFGLRAVASDIVDRGYPLDGVGDFLDTFGSRAPGVEDGVAHSIISNPPYTLAEHFARRALHCNAVVENVALLVNLDFLASQRRRSLFEETRPARVYVLSRRPSMPPGGKGIKASGGKRNYCWIVWRIGHRGRCEVCWL